MVFGDGDIQVFNRFTLAVDIIADRFTKGVIEEDAGLFYIFQTGALITSISAVFGTLVKQYTFGQTTDEADWLIGAGIVNQKVNARALMSMIAPGTAYNDPMLDGKDPQPAHMRDYAHTNMDNGGVHINAGIPNRAFYLIATALGGYAWDKAGRIWYEALRDERLKQTAKFRDFARITLATARRLYGEASDEAQAVKYGWAIVGIRV